MLLIDFGPCIGKGKIEEIVILQIRGQVYLNVLPAVFNHIFEQVVKDREKQGLIALRDQFVRDGDVDLYAIFIQLLLHILFHLQGNVPDVHRFKGVVIPGLLNFIHGGDIFNQIGKSLSLGMSFVYKILMFLSLQAVLL